MIITRSRSSGATDGKGPQNAVTEHTDSSTPGQEATPGSGTRESVPGSSQHERKPVLPGLAAALLRRLRTPLPGAQPRLRFEMPPDFDEDATTPETETGTRFGHPGPRMSSQHPLYMGFMGTVGVGLALLVYWIGSNTTQLLLWIVTALFIALGLDPVVRWLEGRKLPGPSASWCRSRSSSRPSPASSPH